MTRLITEDISLQKVLQKFETFMKIEWQAYLQKYQKQLFYICPKISKFQSDSSMMSLPISWLLDWDLKKNLLTNDVNSNENRLNRRSYENPFICKVQEGFLCRTKIVTFFFEEGMTSNENRLVWRKEGRLT